MEKKCSECGTPFTAERVSRRYCSDTCRRKFHRAIWNDSSGGRLSRLLRQVADSLDRGQAVRSQVDRLRVMLGTYDRDLMAIDIHRRFSTKRSKKVAS
jgi:hypothetical protein